MVGIPLVSIIVPCYNHSDYVNQCLLSIYNQNYRNLELIFVDDCSKDGSFDKAKRLLEDQRFDERMERVVCIQNDQNAGAHATINKALSMSKGDYINIINSDDFFETNRIDAMMSYSDSRRYHLAFSSCVPVDEVGNVLSIVERPSPLKDIFESPIFVVDNYPSIGYGFLDRNLAISTGNIFFTRSLISKLGGFRDFKYVHDWDFILRSLPICEPTWVSETTYFYRIHKTNSFSSLKQTGEAEMDHLARDLLKQLNRVEPMSNTSFPCPAFWPGVFEQMSLQCLLLRRARNLAKIA